MSSPTARTLKLLRSRGWTACVVEKWIPQTRRRLDAFGFGDVLACLSNRDVPEFNAIALVQSTTQAHAAGRFDKITTDPNVAPMARRWLEAGGSIVVHGWRKLKVKRGGKAVRWECDERTVELGDFAPSPPAGGGE